MYEIVVIDANQKQHKHEKQNAALAALVVHAAIPEGWIIKRVVMENNLGDIPRGKVAIANTIGRGYVTTFTVQPVDSGTPTVTITTRYVRDKQKRS